jgi:ribosomal protein S18 acetylase RimI-like enzyme
MDLQRIEEASLNAWPALQQLLFDGWILRFSRGYTKRANSVNPLYGSSLEAEAKIAACERLYAARGLSTIFRLTPFSQPSYLDQLLADRNYRKIDLTYVLLLDLADWDPSARPAAELGEENVDDWIEAFCRLQGSRVEQHQTHKEILQAIPARRFLASLPLNSPDLRALAKEGAARQIVACGLGVLEDGYFGLFDLITAPLCRSLGHGTSLVSGMLRWAQENGAAHAYLQVMDRNVSASRLYARLGFRRAYEYWYRVSDAPAAGPSRLSPDVICPD